MKRISRIATRCGVIWLAMTALPGCSGVDVPDDPESPQADVSDVPPGDVERVADSSNRFGFDLLREIAPAGNAAVSPSSIALCAAMVAAGAEGATRDEMNTLLHIDLPEDEFHPATAAMIKKLSADQSEGLSLRIANAIWVKDGFALAPQYETTLRDYFGAAAHLLDFAGDPAGAAATINTWVAARTNDRITDLVSAQALGPMTRLVLTNAVHFDGKWLSPFEAESTRKRDFYLIDGAVRKTEMMHDQRHVPYFEDEFVQIIELLYRGRSFSMSFVLPRERDGLSALRERLTTEEVDAWFAALEPRSVEIALPKFEFESAFELKEPLEAMGMKRAFDMRAAEFGGITTSEPLFISKAIHKTYIRVDEEGTEAAAATAFTVDAASEMPEDPARFIADHPFLFILRHCETGAILFIGEVSDPAS